MTRNRFKFHNGFLLQAFLSRGKTYSISLTFNLFGICNKKNNCISVEYFEKKKSVHGEVSLTTFYRHRNLFVSGVVIDCTGDSPYLKRWLIAPRVFCIEPQSAKIKRKKVILFQSRC